MSCHIFAILGIGLLAATYSTMTVSTHEHNKLSRLLDPQRAKVYSQIIQERSRLYIQGILIGLVVAAVVQLQMQFKNNFHKTCTILGITLAFSVIYYILMPKSKYMLDYLKSPQEVKAWLNMYNTMKTRYLIGFLMGGFGALLLAKSMC